MAYTKTTWVSGETALSADNMNNIEDGIEELNSNVETIHVLVGAGATESYTFSAFGESRYFRILIVGHGTVSNLRGIYLLDSYSNLAAPILSASNLTVTVSGNNVTIKNTASAGTAGGIII